MPLYPALPPALGAPPLSLRPKGGLRYGNGRIFDTRLTTFAPTDAPTEAPTFAPTDAPTEALTFAPAH